MVRIHLKKNISFQLTNPIFMKMLVVFDRMIADMLNNIKPNALVTGTTRKYNISLVFVTKNIRHYFRHYATFYYNNSNLARSSSYHL